ncbi:MAG: phosphatase PAP2 family protein, partial [Ramlibacter sp.]
ALAGLLLAVAAPFGPLRALGRGERLRLLLVTVGAMLLVTALKHASATSCPWDLQAFGGTARHISHWHLGQADGGPGRCFPAGHASAAFGFVAGYFALRLARPRAARVWLAAALLAGLAFGLVQQWRGAHFASHTLWTGWLCWTFALACHSVQLSRQHHAAAAG